MRIYIILLIVICSGNLLSQNFDGMKLPGSLGTFVTVDFDKDGDTDIVGIEYKLTSAPDEIYILYNDGEDPASFERELIFSDPDLRGGIQIADFNKDDVPEIIFQIGDDIDLMQLSVEDGVLTDLQWLIVSGTFNNKVVDIDGDGDQDIIGSNFPEGIVNIYESTGSPNFRKSVLVDLEEDLDDFAYRDLDDDGDTDIIIAASNLSVSFLILFENNGDNTFIRNDLFVLDRDDLREIEIEDVDDDGQFDLVALFEDNLIVYRGNEGLEFESVLTLNRRFVSPSGSWRALECGDLDGNGRTDFIVGDNEDSTLWFRNTSLDPLMYEEISVGRVTPAFSIESIDIENDDDDDLLVSNGDLWLFLNNSDQETTSTINFVNEFIQVFPNPIKDHLYIQSDEVSEYEFTIYRFDGSLIEKGKNNSDQLYLGHLNSGMFMIDISDPKSNVRRTFKIMKL